MLLLDRLNKVINHRYKELSKYDFKKTNQTVTKIEIKFLLKLKNNNDENKNIISTW